MRVGMRQNHRGCKEVMTLASEICYDALKEAD
jgi:hypothetical protein